MTTNITHKLAIPGEIGGAYLIMLALGWIHKSYTSIPALGYGPILLILLGIGLCKDPIFTLTWTPRAKNRSRTKPRDGINNDIYLAALKNKERITRL